MELSFVIVNYLSKDYLTACLDSIFSANLPFAFEIIIINNSPIEEKLSFPQQCVTVLNSNKNEGFGKANNLGVSMAKGKYLCFLNPDTLLLADQDISRILVLLKDETIGIVGPKLVCDKQKLTVQEWCAGTEITLWDILKNNLGIINSKQIWNSPKNIDAAWVSGAALFIDRNLFLQAGGFDEKFFMYFEDVDLCKKISMLGKRVVFCPEYSLFHWSGKSNQNKKTQKQSFFISQDYYFEKYFSKTTLLLLKMLRKISLILS